MSEKQEVVELMNELASKAFKLSQKDRQDWVIELIADMNMLVVTSLTVPEEIGIDILIKLAMAVDIIKRGPEMKVLRDAHEITSNIMGDN